jgi:MoaA/NifB/PqqE/SkfB family radical SAM enzyme
LEPVRLNRYIRLVTSEAAQSRYGLRPGAEEFPLMVVLSIIYPCNLGCPMCPYTDGNSDIRRFYREHDAELFPRDLWEKISDEAGAYRAWLRCTGGGEPMLHPAMTDMVEYAKQRGARVWMNTNGTMFGPIPKLRARLERLIRAHIDLLEFSMDAGDPETYAIVRPQHAGRPSDPERWWSRSVDNVRAALALRRELRAPTRIVVSMIRQEILESRLESAIDFWRNDVGVDEVITRKFLTWDDNTSIPFEKGLDKELYADLPAERRQPCVWPFERLNVDTLGRVALCGQDISFRTSSLFPNVRDHSIGEIWRGEAFNRYRAAHLDGRGANLWPCRGCSAWLAGVRDWHHGWLKVLRNSGEHLRELLGKDVGVDVEIHESKT